MTIGFFGCHNEVLQTMWLMTGETCTFTTLNLPVKTAMLAEPRSCCGLSQEPSLPLLALEDAAICGVLSLADALLPSLSPPLQDVLL